MNSKPSKTAPTSPGMTANPIADDTDAPTGQRPLAMRNISRKGNKGDTSWWQVVIRRGAPARDYTKTFFDSRYGGEAEALAAAQAWRDEMVRVHPTLTRMDYLAKSKLKKNNTSGRRGVSRGVRIIRLRDGREQHMAYWKALAPSWMIPCQSKQFSVAKYGEKEARRLAMAARAMFEADAGEAAHPAIARKTTGRHSPEMRCIYRNGKRDAWCVRPARRATRGLSSKTFRDTQYGGKELALAAAQAWRDEIERQYPRQTKKQCAAQLTQANTSGKTGVVLTPKIGRRLDGSEIVTNYWMAIAPYSLKPRRTVLFSTEKYGEREAYRLAVEARLAFEAQLDDAP